MRRTFTALLGALFTCALIGGASFASSAAAAPEPAYNNLNTVPATVNGKPDEDTYSQDFEGFPFGGQVETVVTNNRLIKALTTQLDAFVCEHGVYSLENCFTQRPNKKFSQEWSAKVYTVGAGNEPGTKIAESSATFRLKFRPTTNVSCPATSEGKGFGSNCDVGGYLQQVTFKHFTQTAPTPPRVIILLNCTGCETSPVNVGLQSAYKGYNTGTQEFESEPPAAGGVPAIGSDPFPDTAYVNGKAESGWAEFQPVFELLMK
jgi:hypothetical protein